MKFIYWFAYYNTHSPSVRYRGQYPLEFFRISKGIDSYFIKPGYRPGEIYNFLKAYISALLFRKQESLIVIQRVNSNFIYATLLKFLVKIKRRNTIYDLDDADYLEFSPETIHFFIKNCSAVMVGSRELATNLVSLNKNIFINTSPVPGLGIVKQFKNNLLTIGWIGGFGGGHKTSLLKYFFSALKDLPFKVKLILMGVSDKENFEFLKTYFATFPNVLLEMPQGIDWKDEQSIQRRIATFDIGIATLLNTEAQRSKSAFKLKQYMNNGVPVLSSDVAENNFFIKHGWNGFLCVTPDDFRKHIIEIWTMNSETYQAFSGNANNTTPLFNLQVYCKNIIDYTLSIQAH